MFSTMGCIGTNPFYGFCPFMSRDFGFLLGLATATASQGSSNFGSSLYTSPYTNNTANYTELNDSISALNAYNTSNIGFGSLTAPVDSLYSVMGYTPSYTQMEISSANPYASLVTPSITVTNNNIATLASNLASGTVSAIQNTEHYAYEDSAEQTTATSSSSSAEHKESIASSGVDNGNRPQGATLSGKGVGTKYGPEFLEKVKQISQKLNCNYRDLLAIFNSEFGVEANKTAKNGAVGLICFMPQFFDTRSIVKMSPLDQLDVVEQTIMKSKKSAGFAPDAPLSKGDLYALVFLPGRAGNEVLCKKGERGKNGKLLSYYESNSALDYNHDGVITKSEMAHRIDTKYVSDQTFLA